MAYSKLYVSRNDKIISVVKDLEKVEALSIFFAESVSFDVFDDNGLHSVSGVVPAGHALIVGKYECRFEA